MGNLELNRTMENLKFKSKVYYDQSIKIDLGEPIVLHPELEKALLNIEGIKKPAHGLLEAHAPYESTRIMLRKNENMDWVGKHNLLEKVQEVISDYFEKNLETN